MLQILRTSDVVQYLQKVWYYNETCQNRDWRTHHGKVTPVRDFCGFLLHAKSGFVRELLHVRLRPLLIFPHLLKNLTQVRMDHKGYYVTSLTSG